MFRTRPWKNENAQALTELALTLPMLLVMLLGAVELGRVIFAAIEVSNAAKAAVQYGGQGPAYVGDFSGMLDEARKDANELSGLGKPAKIAFASDPEITGWCSDGSKCTKSDPNNPAIPCGDTDCPTSHIVRSVSVDAVSQFSPLIHAPGLPTSFEIHGHATQQVLNHE